MFSTNRPLTYIWASLARISRHWKSVLLLAAMVLFLRSEAPPPSGVDTRVERLLASETFNFVRWEIDAVVGKVAHSLVSPQRYMEGPSRKEFVLDYLSLVSEIQQTERELHRFFADPDIENPEAETAELRARLTALRAEEDARQPIAEAILEEQAACVLADEGFDLLGQTFPPVSAQVTPLPMLLIISPRDRIERTFSLSLRHGLDAAEQEEIEEQIDTDLDVSSLVTGIGGLAAYPAMLLEHPSINWLTGVISHEWTHHYLTPRPLGWNYDASADTRTINETVASIVGDEAGREIVRRYYPEFLPPEPEPTPEGGGNRNAPPPEPPAFDFRVAMRETRIRVDELLAQGKIEEAEAYMEGRRQVFVANGYEIRKLNQAYFAFHGAYADQPGAAGSDPVGPLVRELRARSPDLHTFVQRIAGITTLEELQDLLEED